MRTLKILALGLALVAAPFTARAQEFPRWEAFGGFSYANVNLGPQASLFSSSNRNYDGFDLDFSFNPHRNIRLLADVGFQFGRTTTTPPPPFTQGSSADNRGAFRPSIHSSETQRYRLWQYLGGCHQHAIVWTGWHTLRGPHSSKQSHVGSRRWSGRQLDTTCGDSGVPS